MVFTDQQKKWSDGHLHSNSFPLKIYSSNEMTIAFQNAVFKHISMVNIAPQIYYSSFSDTLITKLQE